MLYAVREKFEKLSVKIGIVFSKIPLTPNQWTIFSLVPALVAVYFLTAEFPNCRMPFYFCKLFGHG